MGAAIQSCLECNPEKYSHLCRQRYFFYISRLSLEVIQKTCDTSSLSEALFFRAGHLWFCRVLLHWFSAGGRLITYNQLSGRNHYTNKSSCSLERRPLLDIGFFNVIIKPHTCTWKWKLVLNFIKLFFRQCMIFRIYDLQGILSVYTVHAST